MLCLPEECSFSDAGDYRPISITSVMPKVFEKIMSRSLVIFWKVTACFHLLSLRIVGA